jgi:branched-chain amino acid transport system substrate-binding protein
MRKKHTLLILVAAIAVIVSACSSSSHNSSSGSTGPTYTLGLLTDVTGAAASAERTTETGVKAGIGLANANGAHLKYVVADAASSPTTALSAAQRLVTQDHVFAVIAISGLTFSAAPYLTAEGVPVIGAATDGPEWITSRNMFSTFGYNDYSKATTTDGNFLKMVGAANIGILGYSIPASANQSAKGAAISAQNAGLKVGYLNADFPLGSTNVQPVAIAMKGAGVDAFTATVEENTAFALLQALRQQGVALKAPLFSVGYGADLFQAGPGAVQTAQGAYFTLSYEPVEMHTAGTERFQKALSTYAGVTGSPSLNEYLGYTAVDAFVTGLKAAGPNPTKASFINTMLGIRNYDVAGLAGNHTISFAMDQRSYGQGIDNCAWITRFSGNTFHLVSGADPVCGSVIPGKTVSSS